MAYKKFKAPSAGEVVLDLGRANPKQARFFKSKTLYTAYGGARGGGKSWAVRTLAVKKALEYDGIRILVVRRTYKDVEENHIEPILKQVMPHEIAHYKGDTYTLTFINGSVVKFGHYQGAHSNMEYQGKEYDMVFIDEATQFTEDEFRIFGACVRGVNKFPKRLYLTCNPGGVGHGWVKRLFIDKNYKTGSDNPEEDEDPAHYSFIAASVEDNDALKKADPRGFAQYLQMLSSLPENMRKAHRYGDWDALGGNYFPEFTKASHVVRYFPVPADWMRYRAIDYGLDALACYWVAVDPDGRSWVYRELKAAGLIVSEAAEAILYNTLPEEKIVVTFAPPDIWSTQKDTGKTMAELFLQHGVNIVKAGNNRVQGHLLIKEMLAPMPEPGVPPEQWRAELLVLDSCKALIEDLSNIQADERNPNDCAKQPHEITHTVDALRYYCISRRLAAAESQAAQTEILDDEDETEYEYDEFMTGGELSLSYLRY